MIDAARLRITLRDIDPSPLREVEVPLSMTFKGLHDAIQAAFLWFDCHLWEFDLAGRRYGLPYDDDDSMDPANRVYKANNTKLTKLLDSNVREFLYVYDMGDSWQHSVEVLDFFEGPKGSRLPVFLDGAWRTPPEDVGGAPGFEVFLQAMEDPSHEDHEDLMEWYGRPFDRKDIEPNLIRIQMSRLANKRRPKG